MKLPHKGLFEPNDEGASAGGVSETAQEIFAPNPNNEEAAASASGVEAAGGGERSDPTAATRAEASPAASTAPAAVTMTKEQLETLAASMARAIPQREAPVQRDQPITPEQQAEFDRQFGVVRITPQIMAETFGIEANEAQCKALETLLHNVSRMSNSMITYQVQQELARREQALQSRFQPVAEYVSQAQAKDLENTFFTEHPDLKDFQQVVMEVTAAAKANGQRFKDRNEAFQYVATRARDLLNKARGGTPPPKTASGARKTMPPTSMGGRTGSNNGSRQPVNGPQAVFGDMDS